MTITAQERAAIAAYTGPVQKIPTGTSAIPLPVWDGKHLRSGESYQDMRDRMAGVARREIKSMTFRNRAQAEKRDRHLRRVMPAQFTILDVVRADGCSADAAARLIKTRIKKGVMHRVGTRSHPDPKVNTKVAIYAWTEGEA